MRFSVIHLKVIRPRYNLHIGGMGTTVLLLIKGFNRTWRADLKYLINQSESAGWGFSAPNVSQKLFSPWLYSRALIFYLQQFPKAISPTKMSTDVCVFCRVNFWGLSYPRGHVQGSIYSVTTSEGRFSPTTISGGRFLPRLFQKGQFTLANISESHFHK